MIKHKITLAVAIGAVITSGTIAYNYAIPKSQVEREDSNRFTVTATKRNPKWPSVRDRYIKLHPTCAACGTKIDLECHHIVPFHIAPELELSTKNLITLCRTHHFKLGHLSNWLKDNPNVRVDAEKMLKSKR